MAELHHNHLKLVGELRRQIKLYNKGATDETGPSDGEVINLCSSDSGSWSGDDDDDSDNWEKLANESD